MDAITPRKLVTRHALRVSKVRKGIPLPSHGNTIYPFGKMAVGDSFTITGAPVHRVYFAASQYGKRHGGKFATRQLEDGSIGVWRVA